MFFLCIFALSTLIIMIKPTRFSEKTKLADLIANNGRLLQLLPRFGIALGFGDRSIAEVCRINNVNTALFIDICNIYSDDDFKPDLSKLDSADMGGLLSYLKASHRHYLDERFPHVEEHLQRIIEASGYKYGPMLSHFYEQYKQEVVRHIQYYEEEVVFPYIEALHEGRKPDSYHIDEFRHNHTNIQDTLDDLMNILVKYLPGNILPSERIEISVDIMELSSDLSYHSRIEEDILIPFVESLENSLS